jgi:type VI protein secretion system component VasF
VELPLIFFVDFMVKQSAMASAGQWKDLAAERGETAGDEKFFDLLETTLHDKSPEAVERLAVFYACMGLGFVGFYGGQTEFLRRKMKEMAARLQSASESAMGAGLAGGNAARICPDAYEHVDTRDMVEPPSTQLLGIGIALLGLVAVLFVANAYLYHDRSKELSSTLGTINDRAEATTQASAK